MHRWLVVALATVGCHHDQASAPPQASAAVAPASTAELDALWAKAPAGAMVGVVVSPRALAMGEHAWQDIHALMKTSPAFAPALREMAEELAKIGLTPDSTLADAGLAPGKGFAVFAVDDNSGIELVPVVDRDKFLARAHGTKGPDADRIDDMTCKPVDGWYVCADKPALFAALGKGDLRRRLDAAAARGDIEAVVAVDSIRVAAVAQLARGTIVVRGVIDGLPSLYTSKLGSPRTTKIDLDRAASFAVLDVQALLAEMPDMPLTGDVRSRDLVWSIAGPLVVTMTGADFDLHLPLKNPAPWTALLQLCAELPSPLPARLESGKCRVPIPKTDADAIVAVEGKDLRVSMKAPPGVASTPAKLAASALAAELAGGAWSLTAYGRGTILAQGRSLMPWNDLGDNAEAAIRAVAMFDELGLGLRTEGDSLRFLFALRTAWANPDDVIAKLLAFDPAQVLAGTAGDVGKAIADAAPGSPFASDYHSGFSGLMLPMATVGMIAGFAIPSALESQKKPKQSEAGAQLNRIGKALKHYYGEHGSFPAGDAKVLPDFPTCCGLSSTGHGIDSRCPNDPTAWRKDKIWSALAIEISDATSYRYGYHSDGKTVTVTATGDTDCDGNFATYTLRGEAPNGLPAMTLVKPPSGVY